MRDILAKLVSFRTLTHDHSRNREVLTWVKEQLNGVPLYYDDFSVDGVPSLVIKTRDTKTPKLWLYAHLDVIDAADSGFVMRKEGGRIKGRGVCDMKFAAACYIKLLQELGEAAKDYDIALMLTTDEETGGWKGAKAVLDSGYEGEACLLPDGGFGWSFERVSKGLWHFIVTSRGVSGHGSRPWSAINAIEASFSFLDRVKAEFSVEPCGDSEHYHNTLSVNKITGGDEINKISDHAEAYVDMRFVSGASENEIRSVVEKHLGDFEGISIEDVAFVPGTNIDTSERYFESFSESAKRLFGIETSTSVSHGSSDAKFFIEHGITPLVISPKGGGHHSDDEWIDEEDLERFYEVLNDFVRKEGRK